MSDMMVDMASVEAAAPVTSTDSAAVETPSTSGGGEQDLQVIDSSTETPVEESTEEASEGKAGRETETHKADGTARSPEEQAAFKTEQAAKGGAEVAPQHVRSLLKQMRDADPKNAQAVKDLHNSYERWQAALPLLGTGEGSGIVGLKNFLAEAGVKTLPELRQAYAGHSAMAETVAATDQLLYESKPEIWDNVIEDLKSNNHPEAFGNLATSYLEKLAEHDPDAHVSVTSKVALDVLNSVGFVRALNDVFSKMDSDPKSAKASLQAIGKWFSDLRDMHSEAAKISAEREKWNTERTTKEAESQKAERSKVENSIAETCDKSNNTILGKSLGAVLRLPFFKDFDYSSKVDLGNGIKDKLYAQLKQDKTYQTQMAAMWKAKTPDRAKMVQYHENWLNEHGQQIVNDLVKVRYPGAWKGGSAAGKAAAATDKKAAAAKAGAQSIATMKPLFVNSKPDNIIRSRVTVGGRTYSENELQVMLIAGKAFQPAGNGKVKLVTWRKQS